MNYWMNERKEEFMNKYTLELTAFELIVIYDALLVSKWEGQTEPAVCDYLTGKIDSIPGYGKEDCEISPEEYMSMYGVDE